MTRDVERAEARPAPAVATPDAVAAARAEAEDRAHDRVSPDAVLDAIGAVDLYIEAFVAGAKFATERLGSPA